MPTRAQHTRCSEPLAAERPFGGHTALGWSHSMPHGWCGCWFRVCIPSWSLTPRASSRGLQTDQRFYASHMPVSLRDLWVPPHKTSASGLFPYFFSCDFRGSSAVPRKAGSALVFLPESFSPEQEVYIHTAHGFHVNRGPTQPPQTEG